MVRVVSRLPAEDSCFKRSRYAAAILRSPSESFDKRCFKSSTAVAVTLKPYSGKNRGQALRLAERRRLAATKLSATAEVRAHLPPGPISRSRKVNRTAHRL